MAELTLEVQRREETGKSAARKMRREGIVPAIVYGGDRDPVAISVHQRTISDLITKSEHGVRSIFLLKLSDSDKSRHAMIRDYQMNPITRELKHVDFVRVNMKKNVNLQIPIHTTGVAIGQKTGGVIDFVMREIEVECLPGKIPDEIVIDVTSLDVGDAIRVGDLTMPEGVKSLEDDEKVVLTVSAPRAVVEEEVVDEAADEDEPEVIRKGKTGEEEDQD